MADLTRRGFLGQVAVATGVGIAGGVGLRQVLAGDSKVTEVAHEAEAALPLPVLEGPMVVHVRDVPSAEISMMVGPHELIYRDPEVVSRLVKAAASAANNGARS
jgi:hypothetical protein